MKLLFDIGNTFIKWAYYADEKIQSSASIYTANVSSSELDCGFQGAMKADSIWVSSVASEKVLGVLTDWCVETYSTKPSIVEVSNSCCGIRNNYLSQDTLGVDRWVAAIGARTIVPNGHVIIIDAGTAVTIDWLSKDDEFQGGAILPGFNLMHGALNNNTAGIRSNYANTQKVIGRTTEECVNAGVSYGVVGAIERIAKEIQQKIAEPSTILLTGGSASTIKSMSNFEMTLQKDLVLLGVARASTEVL